MSRVLPRLLLAVILLAYPLLVLFGMETLGPRFLSITLLVMLVLRYRFRSELEFHILPLLIVPSLFLLLGFAGYEDALLYIPAGINACLLYAFAISIYKPPTVVEQFARKIEPMLPPEAIGYCLTVTKIWICFFLLNGVVAFITAAFCSREVWAMYNSGISYIFIGLLFGAEYIVRQRFRQKIMGK